MDVNKPTCEKTMNGDYKRELQKNMANFNYLYCNDVSKYEKLAKIGQGTFGEVFKARNRVTNEHVALKKVLMENEKEGFPMTALREIRILHLLKHKNVVNLIEICRTNGSYTNVKSLPSFFLVFDFCEHDLAGLLSNTSVKFNLAEIKMVLKQLLNGLFFIHTNKILHRDLKAANILITKSGTLKIADFGLARAFSEINMPGHNKSFTNRVVTLWYRPPELLLGERNYSVAVDMWGAGCIMAEMWTRSPIMQGSNEQHQLILISKLCGSISTESFAGVEKLELYNKMELPKNLKRRLKDVLHGFIKDHRALDLLDKLLAIDPNIRIDSDNALNHDFFWSDPMPVELEQTLSLCTQSNFEFVTSKKIRPNKAVAFCPKPIMTANDGQYVDRVF